MSMHTGEKQNGKRRAETYLTKDDDSDSPSESGGSPEHANNPVTDGSNGNKSRRIASLGWRRRNPAADGTSVPGANGASAPAASTDLPGPSQPRLDSGFHPGEGSRAAAAVMAEGGSSSPPSSPVIAPDYPQVHHTSSPSTQMGPQSRGDSAAGVAAAAPSAPLAATIGEQASGSTRGTAGETQARSIAPMRARRVATKPAGPSGSASAASTGLTSERTPSPQPSQFNDAHARAGNVWIEAGSSRSRVSPSGSASQPSGALPKAQAGMLSPPSTPPRKMLPPAPPARNPPVGRLKRLSDEGPERLARASGGVIDEARLDRIRKMIAEEEERKALGLEDWEPLPPKKPVSTAVVAPVPTTTADSSAFPAFTFTVPAAQAQVQPPVALSAPPPQQQQPLVAPQSAPVTAPVQGLPSSVVPLVQQPIAQSQPAVYVQPAPQIAVVAPAPALPPVQVPAPVPLYFPPQPVVVQFPVAPVAPLVVAPQPPAFVPVYQVPVQLPQTAAPTYVAQAAPAPVQPEDETMSEAPPLARQAQDVEYEMPDAPWDQEDQMTDAPPVLPACQHRHVPLTQKHKMFLQKHFEHRRGKGDKEKRMTLNLSACRGNLDRFPHKVLTIDRRGGIFLTGRKNLVKGF
ncbi:hypothetical protein AA313_de0206614 [Arthrobotrys entomopaga]|nr:hypothetical protein AA313_de0206614 [Arthrobotrys entomopaga]